MTLNNHDNIFALTGSTAAILASTNWADTSRFTTGLGAVTLNNHDNIFALTGSTAGTFAGTNWADTSRLTYGTGAVTLNNFGNILTNAATFGIAVGNTGSFSNGFILHPGSNQIYTKHTASDFFELNRLKIDSDKFSFYSQSQASRTSSENALCAIIGSLKLKPEHIGFEYTVDEKRPIVNVYLIFNSSINGENVNIGDHITYILNK